MDIKTLTKGSVMLRQKGCNSRKTHHHFCGGLWNHLPLFTKVNGWKSLLRIESKMIPVQSTQKMTCFSWISSSFFQHLAPFCERLDVHLWPWGWSTLGSKIDTDRPFFMLSLHVYCLVLFHFQKRSRSTFWREENICNNNVWQ